MRLMHMQNIKTYSIFLIASFFMFQIICSTSFSEIVYITADGCNRDPGPVGAVGSRQPELTSTATTASERWTGGTQPQHCHRRGERHFKE